MKYEFPKIKGNVPSLLRIVIRYKLKIIKTKKTFIVKYFKTTDLSYFLIPKSIYESSLNFYKLIKRRSFTWVLRHKEREIEEK